MAGGEGPWECICGARQVEGQVLVHSEQCQRVNDYIQDLQDQVGNYRVMAGLTRIKPDQQPHPWQCSGGEYHG